MTKFFTMMGLILVSGTASAHPEHASGGDFGLVHFLTDPLHIGLTAAAVVLCLAARRLFVDHRSVSRSTR